ncbi:MAG: hypothetical protein K2X81_21695, partial [Candidatus Obscuribacterales bacterium]|nr:hypothetical protein [Candidatus Obscuribacterales bacterium]
KNPNPPVIIPSNAAVTKNDGLYAAVVKNGKVQFQHIDVARDYGSKMEISRGLHVNDVVLLDAPDGLGNGAAVKTQISSSL